MRRHVLLGTLALTLAACAESRPTAPEPRHAPGAAPAFGKGDVFPDSIALPTGFSPEGIAVGRGTMLYVGSIPTGAIWRGDARTGVGAVLVPAQAGRQISGLDVDRRNRVFAAGGFGQQVHVFDGGSGATIATYPAPGAGLVNDVVVTQDAAYFTDSFAPVLYRVPLAPNGALPASGTPVQVIPLTGDYVGVPGQISGNGIVATPNGKMLVVVNSANGTLYRVDAGTGVATAIAGVSVPAGDGIELAGRELYVVQGSPPFTRIAVVRLGPDLSSGAIVRTIGSPSFRFPSTAAILGGSLYAVNARFDVAPPPGLYPGQPFEIVRVDRH